MAAPSDEILVWAREDVTLPNTGKANKVQPSDDVLDKGYDKGQKPAAEEFNWVLNNATNWLKYTVEEKIPEVEQNTDEKLDDMKEEIEKNIQPFLVPIGGMLLWPGTTPPSGWLELNGQSFSLEDNPVLATILPSGVLPDFRGRFPRGWANGSVIDPDNTRSILSIQEDEIKSHKHGIRLSMEHGGKNAGQGFPSTDDSGPMVLHEDSQPDDSWNTRDGSGNPLISYGGDETRPKNIAVMFIIKTDQAEVTPENPAPTALVMTPSSISGALGYTVTAKAQVIPTVLAPDYPVTYTSSDESVFTVNATTGFVTLVGPGTATLIAEVSTGLTNTIPVNSYRVATGISVVTPSLEAGETGAVTVSLTPANATEPLEYTSSNTGVVIIGQDGTVSAVAAGSAIITVKGSISGVTGSATMTVTDETPEIPDLYGVGSYITAQPLSGAILPGATISGTLLRVWAFEGTYSTVSVGTWRFLGGCVVRQTSEGYTTGGLFLRIS